MRPGGSKCICSLSLAWDQVKILFAPNLIVSGLAEADRARILEAAGPGARIVEAKDKATQRRELPDTDVIFGRAHPELPRT